MTRFLRVALCLVLCVALIFINTFGAYATSVVAVVKAIAVPVGIAVAAALVAIGIGALAGTIDSFDDVVDRVSLHLDALGYVKDGNVEAYTIDGTTQRTALKGSFIETIRQWIFGEEIVTYQEPLILATSLQASVLGSDYEVSSSSELAIQCFYGYFNSPSGIWRRSRIYVVSSVPVSFTWNKVNTKQTVLTSNGLYYSYLLQAGLEKTLSIVTTTGQCTSVNFGSFADSASLDEAMNSYDPFASGFQTSLDLSLHDIAPPGVALEDGYVDWTTDSITVPGANVGDDTEEKVRLYPTTLPRNYVDVLGLTQSQVQTGVTTADPDAPPTDEDEENIITGIQGTFFPTNDYTHYAIDLRRFFPFCIPFDLYDLFTAFIAEPEAPVFKWKIPVPQIGKEFEVEIDLSAWDEVAKLVRSLELIAFAVGLAMVTREKFIRS